MNKEMYEFIQRVERRIMDALPEGKWKVNEREVRKNNELRCGISVIKEGAMSGPFIFMEEAYKEYKDGADFETICEKVMESLEAAEARIAARTIDTMSILRHDTEKFIMQLVDTGKNRELLKGVPHREFMNLSVVYRLDIPENESTVLITNELAEHLELTEKELYECAREYTAKAYPLNIESIGSVLDGVFSGPVNGSDIDEQVTMLIISYGRCNYGASALMDADALKQAADKVGGDIYILPSSIHELIAIPASGADENFLLDVVRMINRTELERKEVLSDCIYRYEREKGLLEVIEAEPERCADRDNRENPLEYTM